MSSHHVEPFIDDQLTVPGHTALVAHNHNTGAQSLSCDDCGVHLGRFAPDRWREKHIRGAWEKHLDGQGNGDTRPNSVDELDFRSTSDPHADYLDESDDAPNSGDVQ